MRTQYASFRDLARHERNGRDYRRRVRRGSSGILVMAPHGGGIEPGTDTLAAAVAGRTHSFYAFIGLKSGGNRRLHIASHHFDEPIACRMVYRAHWILTLHGCARKDARVRVGGGDQRGRRLFQKHLRATGFKARPSRRPGLAGRHPANLCNRGRRGGIQLEIARDLRDPPARSAADPPATRRLATAIARALTASIAGMGNDVLHDGAGVKTWPPSNGSTTIGGRPPRSPWHLRFPFPSGWATGSADGAICSRRCWSSA